MAKFQVIRPFSVVASGKRTEYKVGQRISKTAYDRLTKQQQERFLPANRCRAQSWTDAEYAALAEAYMLHGQDRKACLRHFRDFSDRHSDHAITFAAYSAASLDTLNDLEGFKDFANGLLSALNDLAPGRFTATGRVQTVDPLDALLASGRS